MYIYIYLNRFNLQKLSKSYYLCLATLFKFNFRDHFKNSFNELLEPMVLYFIRIIPRILIFISATKVCAEKISCLLFINIIRYRVYALKKCRSKFGI